MNDGYHFVRRCIRRVNPVQIIHVLVSIDAIFEREPGLQTEEQATYSMRSPSRHPKSASTLKSTPKEEGLRMKECIEL